MQRFAGCLEEVPGMVPWGEKCLMDGLRIAHELQQSSCYPDTPIISTCTSARVIDVISIQSTPY